MLEAGLRLTALSEMLLCTEQLAFWKYSAEGRLLDTNCPEALFFRDDFCRGIYPERLRAHFEQTSLPIAFSDHLGLTWAAMAERENDAVSAICLLGPALLAEPSEKELAARLDSESVPPAQQAAVTRYLHSLQVIDYVTFTRYAAMLYYCVTGESISHMEIVLDQADLPDASAPVTGRSKEFHGTWNLEQTMVRLVEEGNLNYEKEMGTQKAEGVVGTLSNGDPLRQAKNAILTQIVLVSRAAIRGGISPELSYSISDRYVQKVERCHTVGAVYAVSQEMVHNYIQRVHALKQLVGYNRLTLDVMDYVSLHIQESFSIHDIADHLGYADYYLSTRFKKETGENLRDYINRRRIDRARLLLETTNMHIREIADVLHFSSPSYFCAVFRKVTGQSPVEYRDQAV